MGSLVGSSTPPVAALLLDGAGSLYVGGEFSQAGGRVSYGLACWTSIVEYAYHVYLPVVQR
ncbi:MAG: hypothetical protein JW900_15745 [Anaerolineae bacterium]|nr:hypothetical protein [Anaerolineae bacterium]